jgi:aquaporin rerated protein, other eukaryote
MFPVDISVANTTLFKTTSVAQGLFIEMFFTAQLAFAVLMLAVEKSKDTFLAPIGIGLSAFVALIPGGWKQESTTARHDVQIELMLTILE